MPLIDRHDLVLVKPSSPNEQSMPSDSTPRGCPGDEGAALLLRLTVYRPRNPAAVQRDRHICTFKHVRRTGNDLDRRVLADIDLTNN